MSLVSRNEGPESAGFPPAQAPLNPITHLLERTERALSLIIKRKHRKP